MKPYITLEYAKWQLNLESTYTTDDNYLNSLIMVASRAVANHCNGGLNSFTGTTEELTIVPEEIQQATALIAANLYLNRSPVSFVQASKVAYTYDFLISTYINSAIG